MTVKYSVAVNNAKLDAWEAAIGVDPVIKFFTGAPPANCAAANSGTELASAVLPADWMAPAVDGVKAKSGTWGILGGVGAGAGLDIGHYRIYAANGVTCHEQGTVTITGGGGDMTVDNINIAQNQVLTVNTYTKTAGNA
jgi:hypothetical protein